jgi:molybdenum cofactor cytidylyltransferase
VEHFAIVVLAAGSSSRLGHPKQLLRYANKSLLNHLLSEAVKTTQPVVVVLGSNAEAIKPEIIDLPMEVLYNSEWEEGMASSIRCGLSWVLRNDPLLDAVIFMVADQPFVSASLLDELVRAYRHSGNRHAGNREAGKAIVASSYKDTIGVPALFDKAFFPALLGLQGQSGAKKIIGENRDSCITVPFPMGWVDVDTQEDYDDFRKMI